MMLNIPLFREQSPQQGPVPTSDISAWDWEAQLQSTGRYPGLFMGCNLSLKTFVYCGARTTQQERGRQGKVGLGDNLTLS